MSTRNLFTGKSTSGFTLIELVIVLVIIGMLAAVVVSKLDKVPAKAEDVVNATNINELNKFMQMHSVKSDPIGMVPAGLDSLTSISDHSVIPGPWNSAYLSPETLPEADQAALQAIGIENVHEDGGTGVNVTTQIDGSNLKVAKLSTSIGAVNVMGQYLDLAQMAGSIYAFGVGPYNSSASDVRLANISTCPLVKTENDYNHYLLLVHVDDNGEAEYLGVVDPFFQECTQF